MDNQLPLFFPQGILQAGWNGFHQKLKAFGLHSRPCSRTLYQFYLKPDRHSETASVFNSSNALCASCLEFVKNNYPRSYFLGSIKCGPSQVPLCWSKFILDRKYLIHLVFSFCASWYLHELGDWAASLGTWMSWVTSVQIFNSGTHLQTCSDAALRILCDLNGMAIIILFNKIEKWSL